MLLNRHLVQAPVDAIDYMSAEQVGFEPTERSSRSTVFKTVSIDHSDTAPSLPLSSRYIGVSQVSHRESIISPWWILNRPGFTGGFLVQ